MNSFFFKAPHDYGALLERNATEDRSGPEWLKLQGRATEIRYEIPVGRSSLEVTTNYEFALKSKGFETVFSCVDKQCFAGAMNDLYLLGQQLDPTNGLSTAYSGRARYLLAKLSRPEGHVYASVFTGEDNGQTVAFVRVLEAASMETDRIVTVKANEMNSSIEASGHVDLYGIRRLISTKRRSRRNPSQRSMRSLSSSRTNRTCAWKSLNTTAKAPEPVSLNLRTVVQQTSSPHSSAITALIKPGSRAGALECPSQSPRTTRRTDAPRTGGSS